MPPQNILISLRCAPLHQDILHRGLDKRQYSIYTEKGKRATDQPLLPQSHFSAVDCFYRVFFAEPECHLHSIFLLAGQIVSENIPLPYIPAPRREQYQKYSQYPSQADILSVLPDIRGTAFHCGSPPHSLSCCARISQAAQWL